MMKYINIENWSRRRHFRLFNSMDLPHFNLCADVEMTHAYRYIKTHKQSAFKTVLYTITKVANSIEEFRLRVRENMVVIHDVVHPSFTVLTDDQLFGFANIDYT